MYPMENNLNLKLEQAQTTTYGGANKDIKDDQEPRKNKKDKGMGGKRPRQIRGPIYNKENEHHSNGPTIGATWGKVTVTKSSL
jgi:hypothetical protein